MQIDILYNAARWAWPDLRDGVQRAEAEGFGTAWVYDHLSGSVFDSPRMLECFTLTGALAAATSTIGIGTFVVNAASRQPAMSVCAAASMQEISGGRFIFGLGAGAAPRTRWSQEWDLLGVTLPESMAARHAKLVEVLDLCDTLWNPQRDPQWDGFPLPAAPPPVMLGVNSTRLAAVAGARCAGLNVRLGHPDASGIIAAARSAHAASGRADDFWCSVWASWDETGNAEAERQAAELGVERLILVR